MQAPRLLVFREGAIHLSLATHLCFGCRQQKEAAEAAAAKAREEKLRAMQERLAAWQAQQGQQQEEGSGSA